MAEFLVVSRKISSSALFVTEFSVTRSKKEPAPDRRGLGKFTRLRARRATHARAGNDAYVHSGDDLAVHEARTESDFAEGGQDGPIHDRRAAANAAAAATEGHVLAGANQIVENGAGLDAGAGVHTNLRAKASTRQDELAGYVEDKLGVRGTCKEDLFA